MERSKETSTTSSSRTLKDQPSGKEASVDTILLVETPVVGKYNLDQFDIGKGVLKYRAEPADLKDPKLGFDSKAPRFKEIKEEDNEEFDDGQDNHVKKIFDQLPTFKAYKDEAAKQQANRKKMQLRNLKKRETQRFKEDLKNPTPGPGAYYSKRQPNWAFRRNRGLATKQWVFTAL